MIMFYIDDTPSDFVPIAVGNFESVLRADAAGALVPPNTDPSTQDIKAVVDKVVTAYADGARLSDRDQAELRSIIESNIKTYMMSYSYQNQETLCATMDGAYITAKEAGKTDQARLIVQARHLAALGLIARMSALDHTGQLPGNVGAKPHYKMWGVKPYLIEKLANFGPVAPEIRSRYHAVLNDYLTGKLGVFITDSSAFGSMALGNAFNDGIEGIDRPCLIMYETRTVDGVEERPLDNLSDCSPVGVAFHEGKHLYQGLEHHSKWDLLDGSERRFVEEYQAFYLQNYLTCKGKVGIEGFLVVFGCLIESILQPGHGYDELSAQSVSQQAKEKMALVCDALKHGYDVRPDLAYDVMVQPDLDGAKSTLYSCAKKYELN